MLTNILLQSSPGQLTMPIWELALNGDWMMIVHAFFLIVVVYIFIARYLAIKNASKEDKNFMNHIRDFIHDGKIDAATALCHKTNNPIARIIEKGLLRIGKPLGDINTAIQTVGKLENSKLKKNIAILAAMTGIGPMLGFMGTAFGVISAFQNASAAGKILDIALLSSGIYQALISTIAGLIVGIIALICYTFLVSKVENLVYKLDARTAEFMDLLNEPAS